MRTDRGLQRFYAVGWVISVGGMAVALGMWRLHLREVEQRAEEAERTRDEVARRRAVEERLRIARELHDSLTHSISVIQVQAGVAVHLARKRGEEAPPALLAIHEAGADAARELRATLGVLRSQDHDASEDCDSSGLGQLDGMLSRARSAGLPVTVTVTGTQRPLPPAVDQAAYRIVQEALTNTSRHAGLAGGGGQASASVLLHYAQDTLTVQVNDDGDGAGATSAGPGLGLIGMRERVSALGGRLHAGPGEGGGFQVRADLPVRA
jgi:signal transduction histidine kinase